MNLKQYLADDDPNKWYLLSNMDVINLFNEAVNENERLRAAIENTHRQMGYVKRTIGWDSIPMSLHKAVEDLFSIIDDSKKALGVEE